MSDLTPEVAKKFFASLYKEEPVLPAKGQFDKLSTRLVTSLGDTVSAGDQALQALMFNFILSSPENVAKGKKLVASVAIIKQAAVEEFTKAFPTANLDELMQSAKSAGFDVEVLG